MPEILLATLLLSFFLLFSLEATAKVLSQFQNLKDYQDKLLENPKCEEVGALFNTQVRACFSGYYYEG